jgi:L-lactate dehydrogenase complex protein LldF
MGSQRGLSYIVNNNRTVLLEDSLRRETLYCLDCGACLNVCPVSKFKNNTVISYPIKMIKQPFINNNLNDLELSYETTLCGKCDEICPAKISLTKIVTFKQKRIRKSKE